MYFILTFDSLPNLSKKITYEIQITYLSYDGQLRNSSCQIMSNENYPHIQLDNSCVTILTSYDRITICCAVQKIETINSKIIK